MVIITGTVFTTLIIFLSIYSWSGMHGDLVNTCRKIGKTRAHVNFITRCLKSKVVPKGFISKQRISSTKSKAMEQRFGRIRMVEQRRHLYGKLEKLEKTRTNILNLEATRILHDQFSLNFTINPRMI